MTFGGGGSTSMPINALAGTTLTFSGSYSYPAGGAINTAGTLTFTSGTHDFQSGQFNATGPVNFSGGTITVRNTFTATAVTIGTATVTLDADQDFPTLTMSGTGTLTGAGDVTVNGALNWNGGTMAGMGHTIISPGATMAIASGTLQRTLDNSGTATWTAASSISLSSTTARSIISTR